MSSSPERKPPEQAVPEGPTERGATGGPPTDDVLAAGGEGGERVTEADFAARPANRPDPDAAGRPPEEDPR